MVESYAIRQYLSECAKTEAAINFLRNLRKGQAALSSTEISAWLTEHFKLDNEGKPKQREGKFILLKYPDILERSPRSNLRFVTTLCTAIGVLGTFYGIQEGLQDINLGFTDSRDFLDAIKNLLSGMKTAFSTSLMGLGSGSVFTLVLFAADSVRLQRRERAIARLNRLVTTDTTELDFSANREAAEALKQAANILSSLDFSSHREAAQDFKIAAEMIARQFNPQAIAEAASQQIEMACDRAIDNRLAPIFENLESSQKQLQEVLQTLLQNLRTDLIEPIVEELHQSANFTQEASLAVQSLNRDLGGISQSLAQSISTIQDFQQQTLVRLEEFADQLKNVLENTAEIEQQMLQGVQTSTVEILTEARMTFQQQAIAATAASHALETMGNEASSLMRSAKLELLEGLQEINGLLANTHQNVQSELEEFQQNYQARLQEFFAQSIKGMEAQRRAFRESTADAAATFQSLREDLLISLQNRAEIEQQMLQMLQIRAVDNGSSHRD
jgi:hypothetical protein